MNIIPEDKFFDDLDHTAEVQKTTRNSVIKVLRDHNFKRGVEIGVQYALLSERLLENGVTEDLIGIDPFDTAVGEINPAKDKHYDDLVYAFVLGKMHRLKSRFTLIRKTSNEALFDIDGTIDFVYLDGGMDKDTVRDDLTFWFPKLRKNGIIVGNNYAHSSFPYLNRVITTYFEQEPNMEDGYIWWMKKDKIYNPGRRVSVVTPAYNTTYFYQKYIKGLTEDERIDEIVIVDDFSSPVEWEGLQVLAKHPKIQLYRNEENLGEFQTRIRGAEIAKNDWVVFLDADNSLKKSYLNRLFMIPQWREDVIYAPSFGNKVHINYNSLSGNYIGKKNIGRFIRNNKYLMSMFLNTGNYFMNRIKYLEVSKPFMKIPKHSYGDIFFNKLWFDKGNSIFVVPKMRYVHRRRKHSAWKEHQKEMQPLANQIINELWNL